MHANDLSGFHVDDGRSRVSAQSSGIVRQGIHQVAIALNSVRAPQNPWLEPLDSVDAAEEILLQFQVVPRVTRRVADDYNVAT